MSPPEGAGGLTPSRALVLGALHGPTELLPISSSGHTTLLAWRLGWGLEHLDGERRKAFEVSLHAGTAAALLIARRAEVAEVLRDGARGLGWIALGTLPAGLAGVTLERLVEERLGSPASIALGLLAGSVALAAADRRPRRRDAGQATAADAVWVGSAQALALVPGVSRGGATLAAARWRGFTTAAAHALSRRLALPVIAGATGLKAWRVARRERAPGEALVLGAGLGASFLSTLAARPVLGWVEHERAVGVIAAYRLALALAVLAAHPRDPRQSGP